jgi:hypothetical protein
MDDVRWMRRPDQIDNTAISVLLADAIWGMTYLDSIRIDHLAPRSCYATDPPSLKGTWIQ